MCVKLRCLKFQPSDAREIFSNLGLNKQGVRKMCVSQRKTGHNSETVKYTTKITINH